MGFTFVELVAVIAIMGILSVVALPRLVGGDVFGGEEITREFISNARLAQQQAMAHTDQTVGLNVSRNASGYAFDVTLDPTGAPISLFHADAPFPKVNVTVAAGVLSGSLNVGQTLAFAFTTRSDLSNVALAGTSGAVANGVALTIDGAHQTLVCIAASGYAHRGSCL